MAVTLSVIVAKDGAGNTVVGGVQAIDLSGAGTGPWSPGNVILDGLLGVQRAAVVAVSTAPVTATHPALVTVLRPDSAGIIVTGTAGSASTQVLTVQGIASMTPILATLSGTNSAINLIPATSGGLSLLSTITPNNTTAVVVKGSAGQLYKVRATNNSSTIAYIKIYNATSATAGSGTPVDRIMIPAATAGGAGIVDTTEIGAAYSTGITYCLTTGIADNDTTAPAASTYLVTFYYK